MFPTWYRPPSFRRYGGKQIIARIAILHDVEIDEILSPSRVRHICEARWAVMREMRDRGLSLGRIGQLLNRDHTTVLHGLRRAV